MWADLYTDGGVIGRNPSDIGGTWAWVFVTAQGTAGRSSSGLLLPEGPRQPVTNNHTELYAVVEALDAEPRWEGRINSDSWVTLQRLFFGAKLNNVPAWLAARTYALRSSGRLRRCSFRLLSGHPTADDLARGVSARTGAPVSEWNAWCDRECGRLARRTQAERRLAIAEQQAAAGALSPAALETLRMDLRAALEGDAS